MVDRIGCAPGCRCQVGACGTERGAEDDRVDVLKDFVRLLL